MQDFQQKLMSRENKFIYLDVKSIYVSACARFAIKILEKDELQWA